MKRVAFPCADLSIFAEVVPHWTKLSAPGSEELIVLQATCMEAGEYPRAIRTPSGAVEADVPEAANKTDNTTTMVIELQRHAMTI